ncbi:MAG: pyruvate kinase [Planctomycetota bacterium]|nr:pyruvate kinase [Planctomycetota bacterium]
MSLDQSSLEHTQRDGRLARTKIVATIGPASESCIGELIEAGMRVARINFSHGEADEHRRRVELIRKEATERQVAVGILADIQGPKLRLGQFAEGRRELRVDEALELAEGDGISEEGEALLNFPGFINSVKVGHRVYLADGQVEVEVRRIEGRRAYGVVTRGGWIGDRKGVHLPDTNLAIRMPTPKDVADIALARSMEVDMIGVSFVGDASDLRAVRKMAPQQLMVAKIERSAALLNLEGILEETDGIMVARGDLGVETPLEKLPLVQKDLIDQALKAGKFTITATEMLESMVTAARPTRAEVADVANAVLDGTDAVMLSAETAVGAYPVRAVECMQEIALSMEASDRYARLSRVAFREAEPSFSNGTAMAAVQAARALSIRHIVCFTETGNTARQLSRYRPRAMVIALTPHRRTQQALSALGHVRPLLFDRRDNLEHMLTDASNLLVERGICTIGEQVVMVAGVPPGMARTTNVMKLHHIGEVSSLS